MRQYKTHEVYRTDELDDLLNTNQKDYPKTFKIENLQMVSYPSDRARYTVTVSWDVAVENKIPVHSALREP